MVRQMKWSAKLCGAKLKWILMISGVQKLKEYECMLSAIYWGSANHLNAQNFLESKTSEA